MTSEIEQLSCQELVELVTDYLEGTLPDEDRLELERHLETCDGCRQYVEQMHATIALTGEARSLDLAPEAEKTLLAAFRDWKSG
jgi:anti-sigma factor RsiW